VRLLSDFELPQVEINVAYPSRRHLPAKVRTFIDHLVEYFSQTPNHQVAEQWLRDGRGRAVAAPHAEYRDHPEEQTSRSIDGDLDSKVSKSSRVVGRVPAPSPF
jgi:hypothetical protein